MHRLYFLQAHKPLELDISTIISTSLTSPRFSQLLFWPAGFLTSLVVSENITDIFFAIWTLWAWCVQRPFFGLIQFSSPPIFLHIIGDKHLCSSNSKWKKDCKTKSLKERCYIISVGQQSRGNTHSEGRHAPGQRTLEQTDI